MLTRGRITPVRLLLCALSLVLCSGQIFSVQPTRSAIPLHFTTRDDITNLLPGNATGNEFDGRLYAYVSGVVEDCECTQDSFSFETPCSAVVFENRSSSGHFLEVIQQGNQITFRSLIQDSQTGELIDVPLEQRLGAASGPGSLYQDDTFVLGAIGPVLNISSNEIIGEQLILGNGQFSADLLLIQSLQRIMSRVGDYSEDCQYTWRETLAIVR